LSPEEYAVVARPNAESVTSSGRPTKGMWRMLRMIPTMSLVNLTEPDADPFVAGS
jgi:hypothetical protein